MAPRKAKTEATTPVGVDDTTMILTYLLEQNRPYSATDISANLHNKVSKGQAVKILAKLEQKGEITGRTAGKQTVYHTPQNPTSSSNTPETIALLNSEIELLNAELATLKSEEKKSRSSLSVLLAIPRIADLRLDIQRLGNERDEMQARARVDQAETEAGATTAAISPEERARLENEWKAWFRQASIRRRICRDMWERCSEVLPGGMSAMELWESLGLEGANEILSGIEATV